ncbi:MAG TPA: hypothetical protein P5121_12540 [Caldilineaceae bacterium]|nr:hypothetical protein [Caldilineaceae bacterium]
MQHLELADHEIKILQDIVTYYLSELRMEIAGTDQLAFRENLKGKEQEIKQILATLEQATRTDPAHEKVVG